LRTDAVCVAAAVAARVTIRSDMPSQVSLSRFFASMGAPLKNVRWSWGAQRADGSVFLREWDVHRFTTHGKEYVTVAHSMRPALPREHGWRERAKHIQSIKNGAPCFLVMCSAKDFTASPREIESFDTEYLLVGGDVIVNDGRTYVEVVGRKSVSDFLSSARR
jgi:hypothetical protein